MVKRLLKCLYEHSIRRLVRIFIQRHCPHDCLELICTGCTSRWSDNHFPLPSYHYHHHPFVRARRDIASRFPLLADRKMSPL